MKKLVFLALCAGMAGACVNGDEVSDTPLPDPLPRLAEQQSNPRLALLDHALAPHLPEGAEKLPTVCTNVQGADTQSALSADEETALMERYPHLAPLSRCTKQGARWIDADSDEPAKLVTLHSFACVAKDNCTGWISAQTGAAGAMSYRYTMEWSGESWAFSRDPRLIAE